MYKVYCHLFPNGKRYIGITRQDLKRRWRDGEGYKGQVVYDAIKKFGWENIEHILLFDGLTLKEAEEKEIELIKLYKTKSHENGYNVENGGNCSVLSESTRQKISESKKDYYRNNKHWNTGKHLNEETKEKIAKAHTGYKYTDKEYLRRKSEMFRGKNNPMYGSKMPKEHKEKLQKACVEACSLPCMCVETGEIYKSAAEAQRKTGINSRTISYVCNKYGYYKTAGGFHWEYVNREVI